MTQEQRDARDRSYGVDKSLLDRRGASVVSINGVVASLAMQELNGAPDRHPRARDRPDVSRGQGRRAASNRRTDRFLSILSPGMTKLPPRSPSGRRHLIDQHRTDELI